MVLVDALLLVKNTVACLYLECLFLSVQFTLPAQCNAVQSQTYLLLTIVVVVVVDLINVGFTEVVPTIF